MTEPSDVIEAALTTVVDATPVFAEPDFDDPLLHRFIEDVAQGVHDPDTISRRYGFATARSMLDFITRHREVRRRIKVRRALWESDDGVEAKLRKLAGHSLLEALPSNANAMFDKNTPASIRLDTMKAFSRIAGVDGLPAAGKDSGPTSNAFVVNFSFAGGKTQQISATVVDAVPASLLDDAS